MFKSRFCRINEDNDVGYVTVPELIGIIIGANGSNAYLLYSLHRSARAFAICFLYLTPPPREVSQPLFRSDHESLFFRFSSRYFYDFSCTWLFDNRTVVRVTPRVRADTNETRRNGKRDCIAAATLRHNPTT